MRFTVWFLICCLGAKSFAQQPYHLKIVLPATANNLHKSLVVPKEVKDSIQVYNEAEKLLGQLQFKGYLLAEITSLSFRDQEVVVAIAPNQLYQWVQLSAGNLPVNIRQAIGFHEKNYKRTDFNARQLSQLFETFLAYYENNGYPFAAIGLDSIAIGEKYISASIKAKPNQKFLFDTIQVVGNAQIAQKYLQSYLNIKNGMPYAEKSITQIGNRLHELPFLEMVKPAEVRFSNGKAAVLVFVNKKNASQFDGVIGLQQNGSTNKTQLVGNLKLNLQNAFKRGEQLSFNYQGLPQSSQLLDIKAVVPHVLNTDFGLSPGFYLYKQDTSFLNVDTKLGFNYLLKGK